MDRYRTHVGLVIRLDPPHEVEHGRGVFRDPVVGPGGVLEVLNFASVVGAILQKATTQLTLHVTAPHDAQFINFKSRGQILSPGFT